MVQEKMLVKVEFTHQDKDGKRCKMILEGEDALVWEKVQGSLCTLAEIHGFNQDWAKLNWKKVSCD